MDTVVLSSARWSSHALSKQRISSALASLGHDVLYVDPPVSAGSLARHPGRWRELVGLPTGSGRVADVSTWTPRVLPGQNSAFGQAFNARLVRRGIARRSHAPELVIGFALEARSVFPTIGGRRVYYCTDSTEDLPGVDADAVREWELGMARAADLVVAASRPLQRQLRDRGIDATYLPHGVEPIEFVGDLHDPQIAALPRPVVGYVGSLNFRVDPALLQAALVATAGGTLVIVGDSPTAHGPTWQPPAFVRQHDVRMLPPRHGTDLAALLRSLDVAVVPYADTPFNRKSFPLKVAQFLAAGVPVVSTPNGATEEYADAVHIAADPVAFATEVRKALLGGADAREAAKRRVLERSWRVVASELLELVGRLP